MKRAGIGLCVAVLVGLISPAETISAQASSLAPWTSPNGHVTIQHPADIAPTADDKPLGSMMTGGWRLMWDGTPQGPGRLLVRFRLKVLPKPPEKTASEVLQIGESRDPAMVRTCTSAGLDGPDVRPVERSIGDVAFTGAQNADAGMSQSITALDLRAVVGGTCYAVDRFAYAESASNGDPAVSLPQAKGAAILDRMLQSLRITP